MTKYFSIKLENVELFGYHGYFPEERKIGMGFNLNATIIYCVEETKLQIHHIIDYTVLINLIKKRWQKNELLLESLLLKIAEDFKQQFSNIREIHIEIKKKFNNIEKFNGNIAVSFHQKYD